MLLGARTLLGAGIATNGAIGAFTIAMHILGPEGFSSGRASERQQIPLLSEEVLLHPRWLSGGLFDRYPTQLLQPTPHQSG